MAINMNTARKLCTKPELELVVDSSRTHLGELSAKELLARVRRARTLRDKYQALASRQRRISRGKQEARGARPSASNENTLKKRDIFGEVLARFETKLEKVAADEAKTAPSPRAGSRKKAGKKTRGKPSQVAASGAGEGDAGGGTTKKKRAKLAKKKTVRAGRLLAGLSGSELAGAGGKGSDGGFFGGVGVQAARNTSLKAQSRATKGKRVKRRKQAANQSAILGHVSSRGRRNQAKRDSR